MAEKVVNLLLDGCAPVFSKLAIDCIVVVSGSWYIRAQQMWYLQLVVAWKLSHCEVDRGIDDTDIRSKVEGAVLVRVEVGRREGGPVWRFCKPGAVLFPR